jgi:hypothetical protein
LTVSDDVANVCSIVLKLFRGFDMADLVRPERLQIMLSPEELIALDDWRFTRRMPSRASAVRELLKRGLAAEGFLQADGQTKSQDFGVIGGNGHNLEP